MYRWLSAGQLDREVEEKGGPLPTEAPATVPTQSLQGDHPATHAEIIPSLSSDETGRSP